LSRIAREVEEYLGYFDAAFLYREKIVGLCVEKMQRNREIVEKDFDYCFKLYSDGHQTRKDRLQPWGLLERHYRDQKISQSHQGT